MSRRLASSFAFGLQQALSSNAGCAGKNDRSSMRKDRATTTNIVLVAVSQR